MAGLQAAKKRGRTGVRPRSLSEKDIKLEKAMLAEPAVTMADVCEVLSTSHATIYQYIQGGRAASILEGTD